AWQCVGGVKMHSTAENFGAAILQSNLHLACQNKHPLRLSSAVKLTAKANRAGTQLVALSGKYF
ncbi:hypothetical protein JZU54_03680, partial [bacterium]|nr:hypothetical protein [bacterium]